MVKEKSINLFGIFVQKALLIRSARRKKKIILSMSLSSHKVKKVLKFVMNLKFLS